MQARTPLCLEYTRARDLGGQPVIADGLARVSVPRSARKHVRGVKQSRLLEVVSVVMGPHDNALHYNVTMNTDCAMNWASMRLAPALMDADLVRWLVAELTSRSRSCYYSISCSVGHCFIMGSGWVFLSVVCSLVCMM